MVKRAKSVDQQAVARRQAANVMKQLQGSVLASVGTVRNYEERLTFIAKTINAGFQCGLRDLTVDQAHQYLTDRATEVGQKTLDMERQALQIMMQHVTKTLSPDAKLAVVKSEQAQNLTSRAYTTQQVQMIAEAQNSKNSLSTKIAHATGLRAHELYTLRRIEERRPSDRPALPEKFSGRDGVRYTAEGKGGLVREVQLPSDLSRQLEAQRLETPITVTDRGIHYQTHYDVAGGKNWSNSFTAAANRSLNWSAGAHGLRHSYAQERMKELQSSMSYSKALEVVSQEMGHFRPEITEVYLR